MAQSAGAAEPFWRRPNAHRVVYATARWPGRWRAVRNAWDVCSPCLDIAPAFRIALCANITRSVLVAILRRP